MTKKAYETYRTEAMFQHERRQKGIEATKKLGRSESKNEN